MARRKSLPSKIGGKTEFTPRLKEVFLDVFQNTFSVKKAAEAVGFTRQTIYKHLKQDEEFAKAYEKANDAIVDSLEAEAYRRAMGYKKPVYYQGELVGYELAFSDKLLEMLLRGRSDKYSNKTSLEINGKVEHEHNINSVKEKLLDKALSRGIVLDQEPEEAEFEEIKEEDTDQGEEDDSSQ